MALVTQWALPVWAAGVLFFALRLTLGYCHLALLRRSGEAAEAAVVETAVAVARRMSIARPVRLLVTKIAESPSVVGWLRPVILLPAAVLANLDADQLEAILAHELAHILRRDFLVNALQTVVETLLFYHPATWWVSRRIRQERELCCDDLAVQVCGDALRYARALTRLERMRIAPQPAVAANGGSLLYRVQRLTGSAGECAPARLPAILTIVVAAACLPLTVHRALARQDPPAYALKDGVMVIPDYPEAAVRKGITGSVLIDTTLDADGAVVDAHVLTGPVELRKAALEAVLKLTFATATAGEVRQVKIDFTPQQLEAARIREKSGAPPSPTIVIDTPQSSDEEELRREVGALRQKLERMRLPRNEREEQRLVAVAESSGEDILRTLEERLAGMRQILGEHNPEIVNLRARIAAVQRQITRELAGRKLILIEGDLPRDIQLPVHVGDVLTQTSMDETIAMLHETALYLDVQFLIAGENEIVIRIVRR
jgi:TonB family protein